MLSLMPHDYRNDRHEDGGARPHAYVTADNPISEIAGAGYG